MTQRELFIDKVRNRLISVSIRLAGKTTVKLGILRSKAENVKLGILRSKAENVKQKVVTLSVKYVKHAVPENSADEKLKSLGSKHHHGNKTSGQQIRGSKSSLASNTESINQQQTQTNKAQPPPTPTPSIESSQLETVADIHCSEPSLNESVNITGTDTPDDVIMADRRPQRVGRNDNKNQVTQDAKRRSRSEGRSKGRNSSNKKDGNSSKGRSGSYSKEPVDQQSRHSLYNEPQSDEGGFPDIKTSSSDSEETLQKKWIRNPNMVKQAGKKKKKITRK